MNAQEIKAARADPVVPWDVGGWLEVFCFMLTVIYPTTSLYQIFWHTVPNLISARTPKGLLLLSVYLVVRVGLAVFSFVAGLRLWLVKPDAVRFARRYLWTYLTAHFAYFVFWIAIARPQQPISLAAMGWYSVVGPTGSFGLWYLYLEHSKRVRMTYCTAT